MSLVGDNIQIIRALSNEMAAFLHTLPDDVWRDADTYASACAGWNMADVVAHLVDIGNKFAMSVERALNGNVSPPMGYRRMNRAEFTQSVISLRDAYYEDLFPEFNASCLRLNRLLVSLTPEQYALPAWHPFRVMTVENLIELRAMELAVHGWDVRYGIDRAASLSPVAVPFLKGWVNRWLAACFRAPADDPRFADGGSATIRFALTDGAEDGDGESYDLTVRSDGFSLDASDPSATPDATLSVDTSTYILFLMGRLPLRRSIRRRRIAFAGDQPLAEGFGEWFPGI